MIKTKSNQLSRYRCLSIPLKYFLNPWYPSFMLSNICSHFFFQKQCSTKGMKYKSLSIYCKFRLTNFIFLLDINKRTNTVTLFLLFAVRVEIAKGEKNLQEEQKSKHHPMFSFWWLFCEICIPKPRTNVWAFTHEPTSLVCSLFSKLEEKRKIVVYSGSNWNIFSNVFLHENCLETC